VMQTGRNQGMQTMSEHLLNHVKAGLVEPEEAYMKSNDKLSFKDLLKTNGITLRL
jgi:Tfp pilus assembly pilus retraction ATPase PilT